MKIEKNKVVLLDFELKDGDGVVLENSETSGELPYIHGMGNLLPILEKSLEGKKIGENIEVTVMPMDGYGEYDDENVFFISKDNFDDFDDIYEGLEFHADTDDGPILCTIKSIEDEQVLIDTNHPYAGKTLNFKFTVLNIRDATEEELEHGHVHMNVPF